jgi:hypothetical protein
MLFSVAFLGVALAAYFIFEANRRAPADRSVSVR